MGSRLFAGCYDYRPRRFQGVLLGLSGGSRSSADFSEEQSIQEKRICLTIVMLKAFKAPLLFGSDSLRWRARGYSGLGTGSDVRRVLVQSNILVTTWTLEHLHLRSDVSPFPVSSSQFLNTSICFLAFGRSRGLLARYSASSGSVMSSIRYKDSFTDDSVRNEQIRC
jgi:hypothetical protein